MNPQTIQNLIKLLLSFLISLLPLHTILAQDKDAKQEPKTMRVKMFKSVDGKLVYSKDTVVNVADHAELLRSIKGLRVDTASWRKLNSAQFLRVDSLTAIRHLRAPLIASFRASGDSAVWKRLKEAKVQVYKMDKALSEDEKARLFERMKSMPGDTVLLKALKREKVYLLNADSTKEFKRFRIHADGADNAIRIFGADTSRVAVIRSLGKSGVTIHGGAINSDVITERYTTSRNIKIETDSTGKVTVYEIDEQGNQKQLEGHHFGKSGEKATVIIIRKVNIENLTTEDVSALKKTGTPVETKPKEELELEQIEYYPNPNDGKFNLRFKPENKGTTVVRVLDSKGQEVFVDTVEKLSGEYSRQIDLSPFGKGLYFLQIAQGKRYHTKKILVR